MMKRATLLPCSPIPTPTPMTARRALERKECTWIGWVSVVPMIETIWAVAIAPSRLQINKNNSMNFRRFSRLVWYTDRLIRSGSINHNFGLRGAQLVFDRGGTVGLGAGQDQVFHARGDGTYLDNYIGVRVWDLCIGVGARILWIVIHYWANNENERIFSIWQISSHMRKHIIELYYVIEGITRMKGYFLFDKFLHIGEHT